MQMTRAELGTARGAKDTRPHEAESAGKVRREAAKDGWGVGYEKTDTELARVGAKGILGSRGVRGDFLRSQG